ncbi:GIY-YIG nuclease family protein [Paracoccus sp. (in: a-proteobacteria)]|uniref:GIY-YIG nuclease family protein n=1 Tax=Paracoccus sp. TaxID=267 RepID=UPI00289B0A4F|nr:GIY-YIG nuclease family protein [Paracoccus sp. (in: a-proteobacteria)]
MYNKRGRSIELFFVDGTPDGMVTATIPFQWSGHVLVTRRIQLKEALDREEVLRPGVYLLVGDKDGKPTLYIGETDELRARTKQHAASKDWWETAILVSSSGEPLNKAHARYLEHRLYMRAADVGKVALENSQTPTESKLSDAARAHMDDFLENMFLVLPALRFDFFTQNTKPIPSQAISQTVQAVHFTFEVMKNGIKARAHIDDGDFVVEAGSLARRKWEGAVHSTYMALHQELLDQGILHDNGAHAIFTQSYGFSSASAAAAVVAGRPASGPKSWLLEGTTQQYGEWEAKRLEQTATYQL